MSSDQHWMNYALKLASDAESRGEVPIGAVLVCNESNEVLGEGFNSVISQHDPSAHAEIVAIRNAGKKQQNYRLVDTSLYVTLEPCPMCAMAIVHARISRLIYGAPDPKLGCFTRHLDFLNHSKINHVFDVSGGVMSEDCAQLLKSFFKARR